MFNLPGQLITTATGFQATDSSSILKPMFGTVGKQYIRFFIHREYNELESNKNDIESWKSSEMCEITNDRFSKYACRVQDLSPEQKVMTAQLYQMWKQQKDSTETQIMEWAAVTDLQKRLLLETGINTVEQLHRLTPDQCYALGPYAAELKNLARRHVESKEPPKTESDERLRELQEIMSQNGEMIREQSAKIAELEKQSFERHLNASDDVAATTVAKRRGRPKKNEGLENASV